jgi:adenylate kinase family enzyme
MEVDLRRLLGEAAAGADRHRGTADAVVRRIVVVGNTGSGKTTLARRLAARLGAQHVELDALFWGPNWRQATAAELRARVEPLLGNDHWVVDGNYLGKLGTSVLERADMVVWLDPPFRTILARLVRRTTARIRSGEELWSSGNYETWRGAFLHRDSLFWWAVKMHVKRKRTWPALLARYPHVRFTSAAAAERWLETARW